MLGDVHPNIGPATKYVCNRNVTSRGVSYNEKIFHTVMRKAASRHILHEEPDTGRDEQTRCPSCVELSKEFMAEQYARQRTKLLPSTESSSHRPGS